MLEYFSAAVLPSLIFETLSKKNEMQLGLQSYLLSYQLKTVYQINNNKIIVYKYIIM
jgi:hypothetical protein